MRFYKPATEAELLEYEQNYKVVLPQKYKEWLLFSDGGELFLPAGLQLFGVVHRPIIDINDDWCPDSKHIVIGAMSWGDPILCEKSSETISIFDHDTRQIDESYEDFYDFLRNTADFADV